MSMYSTSNNIKMIVHCDAWSERKLVLDANGEQQKVEAQLRVPTECQRFYILMRTREPNFRPGNLMKGIMWEGWMHF